MGLTRGRHSGCTIAKAIARILRNIELQLPVVAKNGIHPALGYACNAGSGHVPIVGEDFGVQVSAVPLPGSLWLFAMPILGLTATVRRTLAA